MLRAVCRNGDHIAYAELGAGSDPAIVFIHDWGTYRSYLAAQQSCLAARRRTISVDLRGHGASSAPLRGCGVSDFAEDVLFLCETIGLERVLLVGHGLGAAVALEAAVWRPDLVAGVAMIDGFVCLRPDAGARIAVAGSVACENAAFRRMEPLLFHKDDDPAIRRLVARSVRRASSYARRASLAHLAGYDAAGSALRADMPVTYIATDNVPTDLVTLATLCRRLDVVRLAGVGHFAPVLQPERVNAALTGFVTGAASMTARAAGGKSSALANCP